MAGKAHRIRLFSFDTVPMRTFHVTWLAFFASFFAWFSIAPLMAVVRKEMSLTPGQVGNIIIASSAITIFVRLIVGKLCDTIGPRRTYTWLLLLGSLPVMGLGLAWDYASFMVLRLLIGGIGASFVITQYHTTRMFASNCVGTANATTAGWGNMGGGAAQALMPLILSGILALGVGDYWGWRLTMLVPGIMMIAAGLGYHFLTQDEPDAELNADGSAPAHAPAKPKGSFREACKDLRVWVLALAYAASFGLEITLHNVASMYFIDQFKTDIKTAGLIVGVFGMLAIFARTLGGYISDKVSLRNGLRGRGLTLGLLLLAQGLFLMLFAKAGTLAWAIVALSVFGLAVHMACGATYALIPFINRKSVGSVAGIVGAGGNVGAVLSGFLFKGMEWPMAMMILGGVVAFTAVLTCAMNFHSASAHAEDAPVVPVPVPVDAA